MTQANWKQQSKQQKLDKDDYTEKTWSDLEAELKEAQDDLANAAKGKTSQESVDESTAHLNAAIAALEKANKFTGLATPKQLTETGTTT